MINFFQISDLHISGRARGSGSFIPGRERSPDYAGATMRGHDRRVAFQLSNRWASLQKEFPGTSVVVSGDITRSGKGLQFGLAHRFLYATWTGGDRDDCRIGLNCTASQLHCVPGKYDLRPPRTPNQSIIHAHFGTMPSVRSVVDASRKFEVQLIGLDSCSGVLDLPLQRVADGEGAFPNGHLREIHQKLRRHPPRTRKQIRVVAMHNPPAGLPIAEYEAFDRWAKRNKIRAVFTGYEHQSDIQDDNWNGWRDYVEFRCGTTLKAGTIDYLPGPEPNHFRFHILKYNDDSESVDWSTVDYFHDGRDWFPTDTPSFESSL